jgi:CubicO group peptidase (beta-lactamase class C family)
VKSRAVAIAAGIAALLAAVVAWRWSALHRPDHVGIVISGGDGGRLPRADAAQEGFDPRALQAAAAFARAQGARALLVMRHGHLVLEQYGGGADADTLFDGGELARAVLLLAAGVAVDRYAMPIPDTTRIDAQRLAAAIAGASGQAYPQFLSRHLWRALDAAPARWLNPAMRARASDWMRVAGVLLHDGRFEGTQVVPPGWIARLGAPRGPVGAEPFRPGEVFVFHGGATMLWLAPRPDLSVLCVLVSPAAGFAADETRLPRMVMRALREQASGGGANLDDLVPGH